MCVQMNAGTWTQEQLMLATGCRPLEGHKNLDRSKLPPPSVMDTWIAAHPIAMQSTYRAVLGTEPAYTSCHGKFIGTVDYVWFTPQVRLAVSACCDCRQLPRLARHGLPVLSMRVRQDCSQIPLHFKVESRVA